MSKVSWLYFGLACLFSGLNSCSNDADLQNLQSTEQVDTSLSVQADSMNASLVDTSGEKFSSEPGLFKMIQENYLDEMADSVSILVLTVVSGCSCSLVSFEALDSHLTAFRADRDYKAFWLLKGEDSNYSKKIAKYHPGDQELEQPKRAFQEYGLFQNSSFLFEIHNRNKIADWVVIDH